MKKRWTILLAISAVVTLFTMGVQGAASAGITPTGTSVTSEFTSDSDSVTIAGWPSGCEYGQYANGGEAVCANGNGGSWKVVIRCRAWNGGAIIHKEGPVWEYSNRSRKYCPPQTSFIDAGIMTRSY